MACFETILDYDERVVGRDEETARLRELRELLSTSVLVPTIGGRLLEPMSDARLLRFLRARKFVVDSAGQLYKSYWGYRVKTFGARPLETTGQRWLVVLPESFNDRHGRPRLLLDLEHFELGLDAEDEATWFAEIVESIWAVVDVALESQQAQRYGVVLQVDARQASAAQLRVVATRASRWFLKESLP